MAFLLESYEVALLVLFVHEILTASDKAHNRETANKKLERNPRKEAKGERFLPRGPGTRKY